MSEKMTPEAMRLLGFKDTWPKEPWWKHEGLDITFFEMPTVNELVNTIRLDAAKRERANLQAKFRELLGM